MEGPVNQIHSPHLHAGAPGIFFRFLRSVQMLKREPHSPTLTSLHLRHSSFSNPFAALPTSQLVLQPFRCFTYVIDTSPTSQLILQPFRRLIYVTAHSPTLPPLHLRHSSFSNPSAASPTSQLILQPFRSFTYVTAHYPTLSPLPLRQGHSTTLPLLELRHKHITYVTWRTANA